MKIGLKKSSYKCEKCDESVSKHAKFCSNCGNDLLAGVEYYLVEENGIEGILSKNEINVLLRSSCNDDDLL